MGHTARNPVVIWLDCLAHTHLIEVDIYIFNGLNGLFLLQPLLFTVRIQSALLFEAGWFLRLVTQAMLVLHLQSPELALVITG